MPAFTMQGYGIHLGTPPMKNYILFVDTDPTAAQNAALAGVPATPATRPGNGLYTLATELVQTYSLSSGFTISDFCGYDASQVKRCAVQSGGVSSLDAVFSRPNAQPTIFGTFNGGSAIPLVQACLTVQSSSQTKQYISVTISGQISLVNACP
jgi:hypothetical protein